MDFLSFFLKEFYKDYMPLNASSFFLHMITILIILGIIIKARKKHSLSKKIFNIILVLGITGTFYSLTLALKALGQHAIPENEIPFYFFNALGFVIHPLILAFFGWLIVSVMDIFMKQEK